MLRGKALNFFARDCFLFGEKRFRQSHTVETFDTEKIHKSIIKKMTICLRLYLFSIDK